MIHTDEDALICDLAETYQIYDYKQLPINQVAVFSCGLPDNSRIKLKISGQRVSLETMLLAAINDSLQLLVWMNSVDGQNGKNKPKSIVRMLTNQSKVESSVSFESGEEFERVRNRLLSQVTGGEVDGN